MKKIISLLLIMCILIVSFSVFVISAYADEDDTFEELLQQRMDYLKSNYKGYPYCRYGIESAILDKYPNFYITECDFLVLLNTSIGKNIEIVYHDDRDNKYAPDKDFYFYCNDGYIGEFFSLHSPQYTEVLKYVCEKYDLPLEDAHYRRNMMREVVKYYGITEEDLSVAYKKTIDDPSSLRDRLSMLTDEQFGEVIRNLEYRNDFAVKALFLEDDYQAYQLLTAPYATYLTSNEMVYSCGYCFYEIDILDELLECDLTTTKMIEFICYLDYFSKNFDSCMGGDDLDDLMVEFKNQFEAKGEDYIPDTGEAIIYIPLAAVSLIAAAVVVKTRRKRIEV